MGIVIDLPVVTTLNLNPRRVLEKALEAGLTDVIILGYVNESDEYFASSIADGGTVVWLMERLKIQLLTPSTS